MDEVFERASGSTEQRSGFQMLSAGLDGLLARVELIDAARRSLDLQYYIFRADESGLIVAAALLRAAERGVRIRVVLDDGESVAGDEKIAALSAHQGIEIRVFNPLRYRGHNRMVRGAEFL
jgi:putative cardiolipin synthase